MGSDSFRALFSLLNIKPKIRTFRQSAKSSDYFGLVGEGGFEPPKRSATDLQSAPFGHSGILPYVKPTDYKVGFLELVDGLEPPTC